MAKKSRGRKKSKRYSIKEIFQSIQGEGELQGLWTWFIRFSGCGMNCFFCDTDWKPSKSDQKLSKLQIAKILVKYPQTKWIFFTGGEPLLQLDEELCFELKKLNYKLGIETNGTIETDILPFIDHISCSPKVPADKMELINYDIDSMKMIYPFLDKNGNQIKEMLPEVFRENYEKIINNNPDGHTEVRNWFIQPCETADIPINISIENSIKKLEELKNDWRLSIQLHKIIGVK